MEINEQNNDLLAIGYKGIKEKGRHQTEDDDSTAQESQSSPSHLVYHESAGKSHYNLKKSEIVSILEGLLSADDVFKDLFGIVEDSIDT